MTKRQGNIYETMADWDFLKEAQRMSTRRKGGKTSVRVHELHWIGNLVEIQDNITGRRMHTSPYIYMQRRSGQNKIRQIAKLPFHPDHIQQQVVVMATEERIDKALIYDSYSCRRGMGQVAAALRIQRWLSEHPEETSWFVQTDVVHYFENIRHEAVEHKLHHLFKDKEIIEAFMEPLRTFAPDGGGVPLGARPSHASGNIALMDTDRYVKETLHVRYYIRYLDDMVMFFATKAEAMHAMRHLRGYVEAEGFIMHEPKVNHISTGLDFLGYVFREGGEMWWRKSNKVKWLRHRARLTDKRRIRELDDAAWGMLKWGNKHCKRLYRKMVGIKELGIRIEHTDKYGREIIDAPLVSMAVVKDKEIVVKRIVENVRTSHGEGRMALLVEYMGSDYKLIVNAAPIKEFLSLLWSKGVTSVRTVFFDPGGKHYRVDYDKSEVIEVRGRAITLNERGAAVYADNTDEIVEL